MGLGKKKILSQGASGIVGTDNFNTVLYTGNGGTQNITSVGFAPDLVWIKQRTDSSTQNLLQDTVRGIGSSGGAKILYSDSNEVESTNADTTYFASFNSNGFTVGSNNIYNHSGKDYVSWNWKAGGAPTATNSAGAGNSPTSGSVMIDGVASSAALAGNVEAKKMSVNTAAQFSIVEFTSQAGATNQVPHGLSGIPDLFIFKRRDSSESWWTYTQVIDGSLDYFSLNTTDVKSDSSETAPTSTTVYQPTSSASRDYILYSFKSVSGFSKIGSYDGHTTNATRIYTTDNGSSGGANGFTPRFVLIKSINFTQDWYLYDSVRGNTAGTGAPNILFPNDSGAEYTTNNTDLYMTFHSDGFQPATALSGINGTGRSFIYYAIA